MSDAFWNVVMLVTMMAIGGMVFVAVGMFVAGLLGFIDD